MISQLLSLVSFSGEEYVDKMQIRTCVFVSVVLSLGDRCLNRRIEGGYRA